MTHLKNITSIINPSSGVDFPILSHLNRAVKKHSINNTVLVTQQSDDAKKFAQQVKQDKPEAVVVYGGDGTVAEVASVLYDTEIPLIILPGGTANILAKELSIPMDVVQSLEVLGRIPNPKQIDVAMFDTDPLFLRIEAGILADMVKEVSSETKTKLGIFAYPISIVQKALTATPATYSLSIDGKKIDVTGVGLMIANVGNIGLPGISLETNVSCVDGKLDVFVLESNDLQSLVAVGTSTLAGTTKPSTFKHWQGQNITVSISPTQSVVYDDKPMEKQSFSVTMNSEKLKVLV